jgi:hypothetical protein
VRKQHYTTYKKYQKTAIKIIQQSITQGWQGLFALKTGAKRNQLDAEQALNWASGKQ